jgi:parallel beta-helix repeat protein
MTADQIQSQVDSHADGTTFCFASGTYVLNKYVNLKQGNQFICTVRRACILTGQDKYRGALAAQYGTSHQLIKGFVAEHFIAVAGQWPLAGLQLRDYGTLEDNETRYNQTGIDVAGNQTIRGNYVHHNRQYGIAGGPGDNILIESNELAWNNTAHLDPNNDAGGSKIAGTVAGSKYVTWRKNYVHDNYGQGIWLDGNVRNALYEENVVENNTGAGIDHEISWDAVIRNNTLRNNNTADTGKGLSCWHSAQIVLNNSQNVSIYNNSIESVGVNPICLANTSRSETSAFPQFLANVSVSANIIKMRGAVSVGVVGDSSPANVSFNGNTYYVDNLSNADWAWMSNLSKAQWQSKGYDVNGNFLSW